LTNPIFIGNVPPYRSYRTIEFRAKSIIIGLSKMRELQVTTLKDSNGGATVLLNGFIDVHSYGKVEKVFNDLIDQGVYKFVVDLSQVDYLCSGGAGVLISVYGITQENDGAIILVNPKNKVKEMLELLGLSNIFSFTNPISGNS
jgi:anti-anti-sigma factor